VAVCALAAGIKSPALLATAFIAWEWASREATWRGRGRVLTAMAVITLGVLEALALVTGLGWGWVHTIGIAGVVQSVTTPTTDVALLAEKVVHVARFGPSVATLITLTRGLGYLVTAAICGWLLWRRERVGTLLALALSLLLLVALGPVYQPWYLAWGLFCLAPVAVGRWRLFFMAVSIYGTISVLPRFEPLVASTGVIGDVFGVAMAVALAALCLPRVEDRIRRIDWLPLKSG
jgi:alpha-1,6-mannosyltransferase